MTADGGPRSMYERFLMATLYLRYLEHSGITVAVAQQQRCDITTSPRVWVAWHSDMLLLPKVLGALPIVDRPRLVTINHRRGKY